MKHFVTMGQEHVHSIDGMTIDKDTVVRFDVATVGGGRRKAFDYFGQRFSMEYSEKEWNEDYMDHYPGGYVDL